MVCKTVAKRATRYSLRALAFAVIGYMTESVATAQPLRLRADALAETSAPTGLVVLEGKDQVRPWFDVEGLVWAGARTDAAGDVLALALRLHDPHGRGELRAGRFVLATGAVRPLQIDGARALGRTSFGTTAEFFGGAPVVPRFGSLPYEWIVGGRVAQTIVSRATMGLSYVQRRSHMELADEEVGADLAAIAVPWLDLASTAAYDLTSPGITMGLASIAARYKNWRFELFTSHRSPGRMLPATSLFSVLGDFPSENFGTTVRWQAAPRLDLLGGAAAQIVGGEPGANAWLRALLRLDDRGTSSLGLEIRREDVVGAQWTGARGIASRTFAHVWRFSTEIEIVLPDTPNGRGIAWPWGLMALAWRPGKGWEAASAVEASASPERRYQLTALLRLSKTMVLP